MAFRRSDLQEAFFVPGTQPFRARLAPRPDHRGRPGAARVYGTTDPLHEVLGQNYFAAARALLRPGELIYVSTAAPRTGPRRVAAR
jgi:hypothetical protein